MGSSSSTASTLAPAAAVRNFERQGRDLVSVAGQAEGIRFITDREPGLRFCTCIPYRTKAEKPPTHEECIDLIRPDIRSEVVAIQEPASVTPVYSAGIGEYTYSIEVYRIRRGPIR